MGYTTDFGGSFKLNKPLRPEHRNYLAVFATTRRMRRNAKLTMTRPDPAREVAGLPVGPYGGYFVGEGGDFGPDVLSHNHPPTGQPGLWCQWVPNADGTEIEWDGGEKFYEYTAWLQYLILNFLKPWGYGLDGEVTWQGEDSSDMGKLVVKRNIVRELRAEITY